MANLRHRRFIAGFMLVVLAVVLIIADPSNYQPDPGHSTTNEKSQQSALAVLKNLEVKGRAPKTGYTRSQYGNGWSRVGSCDLRNQILHRDMTDTVVDSQCHVISGKLVDPYSGSIIEFVRGSGTSSLVQVDHVVALSDAWQKGAQNLSYERRVDLANDPLNLLAVDGRANSDKGDSDAATWLPPNKQFRCQYVARQIAVKQRYSLWVTVAERTAIERILKSCPGQPLPQP